MRPRGEVSQALLHAAERGPATVRALAERALVGYGVAAYTASRMLSRGELAAVTERRPMVLALPQQAAPAPAKVAEPPSGRGRFLMLGRWAREGGG